MVNKNDCDLISKKKTIYLFVSQMNVVLEQVPLRAYLSLNLVLFVRS